MWADLKQVLADVLRAALPEVIVETHADAQIPTEDTVRVLRAATSGRPVYSRPTGVQDIDLECWVTAEDPADADQRLMVLEERVTFALERIPRDEMILKIDIVGIDPDGDLFRPTVGSRMQLKINWRLSRA
jgi:hypothetical protein